MFRLFSAAARNDIGQSMQTDFRDEIALKIQSRALFPKERQLLFDDFQSSRVYVIDFVALFGAYSSKRFFLVVMHPRAATFPNIKRLFVSRIDENVNIPHSN